MDNLIRKLKDDTDDEVRWAASIALGQIGDPRAIPALEEALKDDDRYGTVRCDKIPGNAQLDSFR